MGTTDRVVNEHAVTDVDTDMINFAGCADAEENQIAFLQVFPGDERALFTLCRGTPLQTNSLFSEYIFSEGGAIEYKLAWIVNSEFIVYFAD